MQVKERMLTSHGRKTYDAVLMDFIMPNMDGPTATRAIRALGYEGLIVGVTGNALDSDIQHFLLSGAVKVLTKPLQLSDFQDYMASVANSPYVAYSNPAIYPDITGLSDRLRSTHVLNKSV
jgi:CheY-like chemotaxis protein